MNLPKITKIFLWILVSSIPVSFLLLQNIDHDFTKKMESGQMERNSGEGLGILGVLLFCYWLYLIVFIDWLRRLNRSRNTIDAASQKRKLNVILVFSVIPTLFIVSCLLIASPNPFRQYKKVKHEVKREKLVKDGDTTIYYPNGNKKMSAVYKSGRNIKTSTWYENGMKESARIADSLRAYTWWDNGQMKEFYHSDRLIAYWEKDGMQTLRSGNGRVTYWYNARQKSSEKIYSKVIEETKWYPSGKIKP